MFNKVKIRGVRRPVGRIYSIILKPLLHLICRVYWGIVLYKVEVLIIVPGEYYIEYFDIGVYGVAMLLRLKVTVYNIEF